MRIFPTWCYQCKTHISEEIESTLPSLCINCYHLLPFWKLSTGETYQNDSCAENWAKPAGHFYSIFDYKPPISDWITSLKYTRNLVAGKILQEIIKQWLDEHSHLLEQVDVIFPVPLHHRRLRQRGFNQTTYLLQKQNSHPVDSKLLRRIRHTPHQAGLSKEERLSNIQDAFRGDATIEGKHILLFDDVLTTGNTVREISKVLMQYGASDVSVLVLAQAFFS